MIDWKRIGMNRRGEDWERIRREEDRRIGGRRGRRG